MTIACARDWLCNLCYGNPEGPLTTFVFYFLFFTFYFLSIKVALINWIREFKPNDAIVKYVRPDFGVDWRY